MSSSSLSYNVAPIAGDNNAGSGANSGWYGSVACSSSNTTISNVNVTANSVILLQGKAAGGANASPPTVTTVSAGSFVANWPSFPVSAFINYYVLSS